MKTENIQYLRSMETLKDSSFFKDVSNDARHQLIAKMSYTKWKAGTFKNGANESLFSFYLILSGRIKEYQIDGATGKERTNFILDKGDVFDVLNLLDDELHNVYWEALDEMQLLVIQKYDMLQWLDKNPQIHQRIYHFMAQRVRELEDIVADATMHHTLVRLSKLLVKSIDAHTSSLNRIDNLPNTEIAKLIGTTRAVVNRHLQELKGCGAISIARKRIQIVDANRLLLIAEEKYMPTIA